MQVPLTPRIDAIVGNSFGHAVGLNRDLVAHFRNRNDVQEFIQESNQASQLFDEEPTRIEFEDEQRTEILEEGEQRVFFDQVKIWHGDASPPMELKVAIFSNFAPSFSCTLLRSAIL